MHTVLLNLQYDNTPAPTGCWPHRPIVRELTDGRLRVSIRSKCDNSSRMCCDSSFSTNMIPMAWCISTILQLGQTWRDLL